MNDVIVIRENGNQYLCDISHAVSSEASCEMTLRMGRMVGEEEKKEWLEEKRKEQLELDRMFPKKDEKTMTKQELMENYTMEQLADMIVKYCEEGKIKNAEIQVNCPNCGTEFDFDDGLERLALMQFSDTIKYLEEENEKLKSQLHRKETEMNQLDRILEKLFDVTHDIVSNPDEFKRILTEKSEAYKTIYDFLPTEPIEIASVLINAESTTDCSSNIKDMSEIFKVPYSMFSVSELRQIAEHLLVYCNANESEGEE